MLFLLLCTEAASGQIALKAFQFRPIGEMGFILKPVLSAELNWVNRFDRDERWRTTFGITYMSLTPRLDSFPAVVLLFENRTRILPGVTTYSNYDFLLGFVGFDYKIFGKDQWNFFTGADLIIGSRSVHFKRVIPTFVQEDSGDSGLVSGLRFRAGVEYLASDPISVFLSGSFHQFAFYTDEGLSALPRGYDIGIGIHYSFNR